MPRISGAEFEQEARSVESTALSTPGIDAFCSSVDWMFAAREAWEADAEPWLWRLDGGYLAFLREKAGLLQVLTPFDRMWGYSCPILGDVARGFAEVIGEADCHLAIITGLAEGSPNWNALLESLRPHCGLAVGDPQHRWRASLDGYWDRRPRKLKQDLRRMRKRASERGLEFERAEADYDRILDIERRSWKGPRGTGLMIEDMRRFYEVLLARLGERARVLFARLDGKDIGYIAGGVMGDQYRGLQFSFDDHYRDLAPGNLMQAAEIDALIEEGYALYDLGIDIDYKARWADERVETSTMIIRPAHGAAG
ncbi:MAG: GNAT family N-acetyltransferase [Planctomycetota bacterium]|jgi:CelD/BcsL family acetyltransferase involved in cellulose biosynthesis